MNGRSLAKSPYRDLLTSFLDHARKRNPGGTTNLNAGYGFHYRPDQQGAAVNRNSTSEYASMVLGVVLPYDLARAQGMKAITAAEGEMARRWQRRVLYGDWTHAGLMNWDTGHGFIRWQLRRYWALAGNGLLAMASSRRPGVRRDGAEPGEVRLRPVAAPVRPARGHRGPAARLDLLRHQERRLAAAPRPGPDGRPLRLAGHARRRARARHDGGRAAAAGLRLRP